MPPLALQALLLLLLYRAITTYLGTAGSVAAAALHSYGLYSYGLQALSLLLPATLLLCAAYANDDNLVVLLVSLAYGINGLAAAGFSAALLECCPRYRRLPHASWDAHVSCSIVVPVTCPMGRP